MKSWELRLSPTFLKSVSKLDPQIQRQILNYLDEIILSDNPRSVGAPLIGNRAGYWRYRLRDFRIVVEISDADFIVVAIDAGHRSRIYRR